MKIQPLRDIVLIKADKENKQTESGILVAREWEQLPHTGEVIAIGKDVTKVKIGDHVHFNRYAFTKVEKDQFLGQEVNINARIKNGSTN